MNIYVVNESSLSEADAWNMAWALNWQARYHIGRSGWRSDVQVAYATGGGNARIPVGGQIIHLLDTSDQQGALGYHDEDGNEVPYARVFVKTSQENGDAPSEVASHELAEMIVDPNVNLCAMTGDGSKLWALEVGDPCQGNGYDVLAPHGRTSGVIVADFVLPNFFDPNTKSSTSTTYRGSLKGPFVCGPQGYYSYIDMRNSSAGWQSVFGHAYKGPVHDPDDRGRPSPGGKDPDDV